MRALSFRPFCPFDGRWVNLWYLSAVCRYTTEIADTFTQMDYPVSARLVGQVLADYGLSKKNG